MNIYDKMHNGVFSHDLYQLVTAPDFGFYQMMPHNHLRDASGQSFADAEHGNYKFHLSIETADVPKAWDIVVDKLVGHSHAHIAKVAKPDVSARFNNPDSIQAGKHITIYTFEDISPDVYKKLIQDIETKLFENGIRPGVPSNADRIIPGGKYTGYRSDKNDNGEYIGSSDIAHLPREHRHNPFHQADPYQDFKIQHRNNYGLACQAFGGVSHHQPNTPENQRKIGDVSFAQDDWTIVTDRSGQVAQYYVLDGKSRSERSIIHEQLASLGIQYEQKSSSLNGGCQVLAVKGDDNLQKLYQATSAHSRDALQPLQRDQHMRRGR